jgi:hypothetical protein
MMLSVKEEIKQRDIVDVEMFVADKKILLLLGKTPSEQLVIKPENTFGDRGPVNNDPQNLRYNLRNMKAVDPFMATKVITRREIDEIISAAQRLIPMMDVGGESAKEYSEVIKALTNSGGQITWVKTAKFEEFKDLHSAVKKRDNGDKSGVRAIAKALSDPGGLEKFGEILAVDAFNHNFDRFDLSDNPMGKNDQLKRLWNLGNVAVCLQNNVLRPIGFDTFADGSEYRDLTKNETPNQDWWGYLLTDGNAQKRKSICKDVAEDLETALGPRNRNAILRALGASDRRLPNDAAQRLASGMDSGALKLKTKLLSMSSPEKRPPGLQARIVALGWAVHVRGRVQPAPPPGRPPRHA